MGWMGIRTQSVVDSCSPWSKSGMAAASLVYAVLASADRAQAGGDLEAHATVVVRTFPEADFFEVLHDLAGLGHAAKPLAVLPIDRAPG